MVRVIGDNMAYILLIGLVLGWILGWLLPSDKMLTILSVLSFFVAGVLIMVDNSGILSIIGIGFIIVGACFEEAMLNDLANEREQKKISEVLKKYDENINYFK